MANEAEPSSPGQQDVAQELGQIFEHDVEEELRRIHTPTPEECSAFGQRHGPADWASQISAGDLARAISGPARPGAMVMAADIRSSTSLMSEALDAKKFAFIMSVWISMVRSLLRANGGWFENFTGDGFVAYWLSEATTDSDAAWDALGLKVNQILNVSGYLLRHFAEKALALFEENSQNMPASAGLRIGVDAGYVQMTVIDSDLAVVGPPVVGAVRVVTAAEPGDVLCGLQFGLLLEKARDSLEKKGVQLERVEIHTKEYPGGQWVYRLRFPGE